MPTSPQIVYPEGFDGGLRARMDEVLRDLSEGDGSGSWDPLPSRIRIGRQFGDGLSGAAVVSLEARWTGRSAWCVAKIGPLAEMRGEWSAFQKHVRQVQTILYAPIVVVSRNVLDGGPAADGEDGAVLYREVGEWAGLDAEPVSLEQVAAAALDGCGPDAETVAGVVATTLRAIANVFCSEPVLGEEQQGRTDAKQTLGPDLRLSVNGLDDRAVGAARVRPDATVVRPDQVVAAGLALPDAEPGPMVTDALPDGMVLAFEAKCLKGEGGKIRARRHQAVVEIVPHPPDFDPAPWLREPAADSGRTVTIQGTKLGNRSQDTWERATAALPGLAVAAPGVIELDGVRTAHPFAALREVLRERRSRILTAGAHGDLNTLNVIVVGGLPFLIDYARSRDGQPVLADPAWLEINLLRHPLSDKLTYAQLVRVQRLLLLGDRVADLNDAGRWPAVTATLADLVADEPPAVAAAVRILSAVRRAAQRVHQHAGAEPWWREYHVELLLAAHRTFKWTGGLQTPGTWRAQIAAAAVGSEALDAEAHSWVLRWPSGGLAEPAAKLLPLLPDSSASADLLGAIVSGLAVHAPASMWSDHVRHEVRSARARVVAAIAREGSAEQWLREHRAEHEAFIDLDAEVSARSTFDKPEVLSAVTIASNASRVIILGPSGAGKTAVLGELGYRLLDSALNSSELDRAGNSHVTGRLPVWLDARDLADTPLTELIDRSLLRTVGSGVSGSTLLAAGAVHVLIDDLSLVLDLPLVLSVLRESAARFVDVPITLVARGTGPLKDDAGWVSVQLRGATLRQAEHYLVRAWQGFDSPSHLAEAVRSAMDAWARTAWESWNPRLLKTMAARDGGPDGLPETWGDMLKACYAPPGLTPQEREIDRDAQDVARVLTNGGESPSADEDGGVSRRLLEAGFLVADGTSASRFVTPEAQNYFAARALCRSSDEPQMTLDAALNPRWYDAAVVAVSLSDVSRTVRESLVTVAVDADPVQAGRLLRYFPDRPRLLAEVFLDRQVRVLHDARSGIEEHAEAAAALAATDAPAAYQRLLRIAGDALVPDSARAECLRALTSAWRDGVGGRREARLFEELAKCCVVLLRQGESQEVTIAALEAVATLRLSRLVLLVTAFCRPESPWPVAKAALAALDFLDLPWPESLNLMCHEVRAAGLAVVERSLPEGGSQRERLDLLQSLRPPEKLRYLLERRFCFEIGETVGDLIEQELRVGVPGTERWEEALRGSADAEGLRDSDAAVAAATLHRLLRNEPEAAAEAFDELTKSPAAEMADRVAAIVRVLPQGRLSDAFAFARSLSLATTSLDGIAALAHTLFLRNPPEGALLAREIHRKLADLRRPERYQWPWADALRRCSESVYVQEELLWSVNEKYHQAALDIVSDHAFLLLAKPAPRIDPVIAVSPDALAPHARPEELSRAATLTAATGSSAALPALQATADRLLADPRNDETTVALHGLGIIEFSATAELLCAAAYLARTAAAAEAKKIHRWLVALEAKTVHPDIATGCLIGRAFLGDWLPLVAAVSDGPPWLATTALNVITYWLDGPCPPDPGPGPGDVAAWVNRRLVDEDLGFEARSAFFRLRREAERKASRASLRYRSSAR